jgi:methylated-DNA-[protein]-cysteine S-methyltransferase
MTSYTTIPSPKGDLMLVASESKLTHIHFVRPGRTPTIEKDWKRDPQHPVLREATKQLNEFFAGKRTKFTIPLHFDGTDFQQRVWQQIARIPHGKTISYSELATRAGKPSAVRAAGSNTGKNPLAIVIPCHRIMGKDGTMTGFGGGLEWKRYLLELEGHTVTK